MKDLLLCFIIVMGMATSWSPSINLFYSPIYLDVYLFDFFKTLKIRYCFTLYNVVSASPLSGRFLFSCPIPDFYANIPALYFKIPCYLVLYVQYHARCASGVEGWGGVLWVAWILTWPHTHFKPGGWFNLLTNALCPNFQQDYSIGEHYSITYVS